MVPFTSSFSNYRYSKRWRGASSYVLNQSSHPQVYYQAKEGENIIDLGLSLRVMQPETYHPSVHDDYEVLLDWNQLHPQQLKSPKTNCSPHLVDKFEDEAGVIRRKQRYAYVKVNMDGIIVGRKICILHHMEYSTLALQLEEMFGKQSVAGLRLFQAVSEFMLFYKDHDEQWRMVGDVPWKEFVERVKRLRIVRKEEAFLSSPSALFNSF